jgi:hypothetical protein
MARWSEEATGPKRARATSALPKAARKATRSVGRSGAEWGLRWAKG